MLKDAISANQRSKDAIARFLKQIDYQDRQPNDTARLFEVLSHIFVDAGHPYLLCLIKIRQHWVDAMDPFLAQHAYPRNVSGRSQFVVDEDYLQQVPLDLIEPALRQQLLAMKDQAFQTFKSFIKVLQEQTGQPLSQQLKHVLKRAIPWKNQGLTLHLMVYDGSLAQAIQFQLDAYLEQVNQISPEFQISQIECHVGELEQLRQDQAFTAKLALEWEALLGTDAQWCRPNFIYRRSKTASTLVCWTEKPIESQEAKKKSLDFLNTIHQAYPQWKYDLTRLNFLHSPSLSKEQLTTQAVQLSSTFELAEATDIEQPLIGHPEFVAQATAESKATTSKQHQPVQERIQDIIARLKQESQDS